MYWRREEDRLGNDVRASGRLRLASLDTRSPRRRLDATSGRGHRRRRDADECSAIETSRARVGTDTKSRQTLGMSQ